MTTLDITLFDALPGCYLILLPDPPSFTIVAVNQAYLKATYKDRSIIGRPIFEVFPDNPFAPTAKAVENLNNSLMLVVENKRRHVMPVQRYDIFLPKENAFEERYWKPINIPVLNEQHELCYIIHSVEDVTKQHNIGLYLKKKHHDMQQQISNAVLTTQEMERMEISRELHDNIIQLLNTARIYLELGIHKQPSDNIRLHHGLELVQQTIDELRKISMALLETSPKEEKLTAQIDKLLQHVFSLRQIHVTQHINLPDESLIESKVKLAVIRIIQEQLSNVVQHSRAKKLSIKLNFENNKLKMIIKDDGIGFNFDERPKGMGLQNIRSRVAMLNGYLDIQSSPGDGCQIEVHLPFK